MKALLLALLVLDATARMAIAAPAVLPPELRHVLASAQSAELYSLEPLEPRAGAPRFHGFRILGQTTLDAADTRIAATAFAKAVADGNGGMPDCFDPRHALRIVSGGHRYDFLLCYACLQLNVYKDDKPLPGLSAGGSPKVLNNLLRTHQVPVSHSGDENLRPSG